MGQHSNPDPDRDEDDLEELGTPFYQGTGLSVRALTAEELQQFLDAHTDQPAQLLGSGWAALDRPGPLRKVARTPPRAEPAPPQPQPALTSTGSLGHPGRSALTHYRRRRAAELAAWTRSLTWRAPLVAAAPPGWRRPSRPDRPPQGRAGWPGRRRPSRLAAPVPPLHPGPGLAARRRR